MFCQPPIVNLYLYEFTMRGLHMFLFYVIIEENNKIVSMGTDVYFYEITQKSNNSKNSARVIDFNVRKS